MLGTQSTTMPYRMRRRGRRRSRPRYVITHIPSSIGNTVPGFDSVIFYAAIAANYATTGTSLSADMYENVDRLQNVTPFASISPIIFNLAFINKESESFVSYAIFKVERSTQVPNTDGVILPLNTEIVTEGLQQAMRRYQPGRIIKYGKVAISTGQPVALSIKADFGKYKMGTLRTGDFYGIIIFNSSLEPIDVDIESRYKTTK